MEEVKPVMVKFIVTKYVDADAAHFKSVVQSLTGKNSTAAAAAGQSPVAAGVDGGRQNQLAWQTTGGSFLGPMPSTDEMVVEFLKY
uniref:VQ domain-containing protein n=1 Tax=Setaria viridis TaxID=4556 RepID=A0A4U6VCH3_SETVI|nr:hypothetical protein SEVIR_3G077400v2 [Setaria viridis]